ncbi:MAG: transglycosylase domain-containing protein [Crocinitomicaceae bacterium]
MGIKNFGQKVKSFFSGLFKKKEKGTQESSDKAPKWFRWGTIFSVWFFGLFPLFFIIFMLYWTDDKVKDVNIIEDSPELQASIIYTADGEEMGRYWRINRKSLNFNEISPNVVSALIATEDERYHEHSGIDARAVLRSIYTLGKAGGASTISQQLAKLLFTISEENKGAEVAKSKWERLEQKFPEMVIATHLERMYTKEEIIQMYLNQFDFLNNAVGIGTAAKVYFNTTADSLEPHQAAMLVGMLKNPALFNPLKNPEDTKKRRNVVLGQWLKNSDNQYISVHLTQEEFDKYSKMDLGIDFQRVDHKKGLAPYFREELRKELQARFAEKTDDGEYILHKPNGQPYDIYEDGLKIYTTIDSRMQEYAEKAVYKHLSKTLQDEFDKNNKKFWKNPPFSNDLSEEQIDNILNSAKVNSDLYKELVASGKSKVEIEKIFNTKVPMKFYSYNGFIDTVASPMDSIQYYKGFLQAGLMSMDPKTGFVKAWVGGPNFDVFAYDHVRNSKRQVGSTIKPFVYAAAIDMGVVTPCSEFTNTAQCIEYQPTPYTTKDWCPGNAGAQLTGELTPLTCGLAGSMNNITVAVMGAMGAESGPRAMQKVLKNVGIVVPDEQVAPAMCLGPMDVSLYNMTAAYCVFANKGVYNKPITILRVEDRHGNVIIDLETKPSEAMSEDLAWTMLTMLKNVVYGTRNPNLPGKWYGTSGSLRSARDWGGLKGVMAGKTGTTQNASDGWYMGVTPDLVTGVWVGADDRGCHFKYMTWGQGGRMALPIWGYYMQQVYKDKKLKITQKDFESPKEYDNSIFNCSTQGGNPNLIEGPGIDDDPGLW